MPQRNMPRSAAVYGIDIGKNIFHVIGLGSDGVPVQKVRFRRDTLLQFYVRAAPAIVGMEACAGSQWIARKIQPLGHKVRLAPAQFVKPYVKSNKTDIIDAEAIAEAATRPTMLFADDPLVILSDVVGTPVQSRLSPTVATGTPLTVTNVCCVDMTGPPICGFGPGSTIGQMWVWPLSTTGLDIHTTNKPSVV